MKQSEVLLAVSLFLAVSTQAAAQDYEFTLDEVDAQSASPKKGKKAPQQPQVDAKEVIAKAMGELRWGLSKAELIKLLKSQIRAEFDQRVKVERDIMRQDALYQEMQERYRRLNDNYVVFDGQKTGWDVSPIGPEFTHGNRETMLVVSGKNTRDLYFFIQGRLWKWFREISPNALEASSTEEAVQMLSERFGPGKAQQERRSESDVPYQGKTWTDGATRVTALQRGNEACLIFEDLHTIQQLAVLRHSVQGRAAKDRTAATIDSILMSDAELEARNR